MAAVVPGTVLTTLIARGVYPDPGYRPRQSRHPGQLEPPGLLVPQRVRCAGRAARPRGCTLTSTASTTPPRSGSTAPASAASAARSPAASSTSPVVLRRAARMRSRCACRRRRIPGIPHEQSIAAGPARTAAMLALDGPTFIATEGWDWIPGIRDRDTGIWQGVELAPRAAALDRSARRDAAAAAAPRHGRCLDRGAHREPRRRRMRATLRPASSGVTVRKTLQLPPGDERRPRSRRISAAAPRGSRGCGGRTATGAANLYTLNLEVVADARHRTRRRSNSASARSPTSCRCSTHRGDCAASRSIRRWQRTRAAPGRCAPRSHQAHPDGWAESLTAAGENSPAVRPAGARVA